MRTLIVIPALNPPTELLEYVNKLKQFGLDDIMIIDDGSNEKFQ